MRFLAFLLFLAGASAPNDREYGKHGYWEERFAKEENYDWLTGYDGIKHLIHEHVKDKEARILTVGCGNSDLSGKMHADGYTNVTNIDYSENVIKMMGERHPEQKCAVFCWLCE